MSRKSKRNKKSILNIKDEFNNEIYGIFTIALGLILLTALQTNSAGKVGEGLKYILMGLFSNIALVLPYLLVFLGVLIFIDKPFWKELKGKLFFSIVFLCVLIFKSLLDIELIETVFNEGLRESTKMIFLSGTEGKGGGIIGVSVAYFLVNLFGQVGSYIIIATISLVSVIIYTKISLLSITIKLKNYIRKLFISIKNAISNSKPRLKTNTNDKVSIEEILETKGFFEESVDTKADKIDEKIKVLDFTVLDDNDIDQNNIIKNEQQKEKDSVINHGETSSGLQVKTNYVIEKYEYDLPTINLLNQVEHPPNKEDKKKIVGKAKLLEETLKNFGVQAKVLQVSKGPAITRYELQPDTGVKVSKIVNLSDDIALNLAASAIRIEAPIPGKAAIGIEIPNENIALVTLREIIDSEKYKTTMCNIPFALGKDISGDPIITDISKMPHLLIAGATGSGKSVCINTLILSLLYKATPESVRLLLIDPKVVELSQYNGIPHLLIPVVTDAKKLLAHLTGRCKR